jgi:hypothetical protein
MKYIPQVPAVSLTGMAIARAANTVCPVLIAQGYFGYGIVTLRELAKK